VHISSSASSSEASIADRGPSSRVKKDEDDGALAGGCVAGCRDKEDEEAAASMETTSYPSLRRRWPLEGVAETARTVRMVGATISVYVKLKRGWVVARRDRDRGVVGSGRAL
jgi:hypothetical protein